MKIIHVPFCYWPDPVGGTEIYVRSLAREQQRKGLEVLVAAPAAQDARYVHEGVDVRRFRIAGEVQDVSELYGEGDALAASAFGRIVDDERPEIVHLHAFTRGVSLRLVREVKRRGVPVVFSYHTPTVSCPRGTLLRWGTEVCEGVLDVSACTRCTLQGHGLNRFGSALVGITPARFGRVLGKMGASGGMWTAARMTELVQMRHSAFQGLMAEVDHVIGLCHWVKEVLLRNGVPESKITVSLQGLNDGQDTRAERPRATLPLRIAFFGRLDPTKGVDILIRVFKGNPALSAQLDIFGVVQGQAGDTYQKALISQAAGDARIRLLPPIPSGEVIATLRDYDLLAVPSQCLETGPRVVLEAFAAGIPVLGSNLGGVAELIQHGVNGVLVEARSIDAWARAIQSVADPSLLERLRLGIRPPRRVVDVAGQMGQIYANLLRVPTPDLGVTAIV